MFQKVPKFVTFSSFRSGTIVPAITRNGLSARILTNSWILPSRPVQSMHLGFEGWGMCWVFVFIVNILFLFIFYLVYKRTKKSCLRNNKFKTIT